MLTIKKKGQRKQKKQTTKTNLLKLFFNVENLKKMLKTTKNHLFLHTKHLFVFLSTT